MDGMGEMLSAMEQAAEVEDEYYAHDLQLCTHPSFISVPKQPFSGARASTAHREAESAYIFDGSGRVEQAFKRWVPHRSPSELYNHGFENLESLGALYSRVSSHIFGDWNACGKVMGLGPWAAAWSTDEQRESASLLLKGGVLDGTDAASLRLDWAALEALPYPNGFGGLLRDAGGLMMADSASGELPAHLAERRGFYAALAARVQSDLEASTLEWLRRLRVSSGEANICLVGGVFQNSVLNGRIGREAGFDQVFIPPHPGDEGIAIGCAAYAQAQLLPKVGLTPPPRRTSPWGAYQGKLYSDEEVTEAVEAFAPWIIEVVPDEELKAEDGGTTADNDESVSEGGGDHVSAAAAAATRRAASSLKDGGAPVGSVSSGVLRYAPDVRSWSARKSCILRFTSRALHLAPCILRPATLGAYEHARACTQLRGGGTRGRRDHCLVSWPC